MFHLFYVGAVRPVVLTLGTIVLLVGLWLVPCRATTVNGVIEWNQIALSATVTAGQGPVPQLRSMTIVQVSVYDAVNGIAGSHDTYLPHEPAPAGASPEAAAIAAAHHALVSLFPAQKPTLDTARAASLAMRGLTEADPGINWGEAVATDILAARANDGAAEAQFPYTAPGAGSPGVWVPVGPAPAVLPGWGSVSTWVLESGAQFRPDEPPSLTSDRWARDYNEVMEIGSLTSTSRTAQQTEIARFWLASPAAIWNYVAVGLIQARGLDVPDAAHALALMYLAASDASIACWDAKYTYNFWRPITAIHNGDLDRNDETIGDPTWQPLFPTPQHPEYPSAHATNSSAMATVLAYLFGDDPGVPIVAISPTNPGFQRQWSTFDQGVDEVMAARIYSGIHYRTSVEIGSRVGRRVARFVIHHALR